MLITVNGHATYCYTGGKPFDAAKPSIIFIHGVLNDHSVWILQSRYLAHHGWNVLAVDLPGHCRSAGEPASTVEAAADFIVALMDAAGLARAVLVGHSFGALVALEAAARAPNRVPQLVLVGVAAPMKVSPALLEASLHEPMKALTMVNVFSRSTLASPPSALGPGTWVYGASMALGRRVLASKGQRKASHSGTNRRGWPKSNRPRCSRALSRVTPISRLPSSSLPSAAQLLSQPMCRPSTSRGTSNNQGCSGLNTQANQPS